MRDPRELVAAPGTRPREGQLPAAEWTREPAVGSSPDLLRVLQLPRRPDFEADADRQALVVASTTARFRRKDEQGPCRCDEIRPGQQCILELSPVQAAALHELAVVGGLAGELPPGEGKTLLAVLAALALADHGVRHTLLLVPPKLQEQLADEHLLASQHWEVPSLFVEAVGYNARFPGRPRVTVASYYQLSRPENSTYLDDLRPDAILCDEAQRVRDRTSSTHIRVRRYLENHPWVKFAWWTGSPTESRLEDYDFLNAWALGEGSPLPLVKEVTEDWGRAVNARKRVAGPGALLALCEPGEHVREGIRRRRADTLGVVVATAPSFSGRVTIDRVPDPVVPRVVADALRRLREDWVRPDGEELMDAVEVSRSACEISCGFSYHWTFPRGEPDSLIDRWFDRRKDYHKEVREVVRRGAPNLDSPKLVLDAALRHAGRLPRRGELPVRALESLAPWEEVRDLVRPVPAVTWLSEFYAEHVAEVASRAPMVVWYQLAALGEAVERLAKMPRYGAGASAKKMLVAESGERSVLASQPAHGVGTNGLQFHFWRCFLAQHGSSNTGVEQTIARLARKNQPSPVVEVLFSGHTRELRQRWREATRRAEYVEATTGSAQRLGSAGVSFDEDDEDEQATTKRR